MVRYKCIICEQRPAFEHGWCKACAAKIERERKASKPERPVYYVTYRGGVVGMYRISEGKLRAKCETRSPESLPKRNTIDLNVYCAGYTREQIKKLKAGILGTCEPRYEVVKSFKDVQGVVHA